MQQEHAKRIATTESGRVSLIPPLPLARELKVVPMRTHEHARAGLRLRRSPGLAACPKCVGLRRGLPNPDYGDLPILSLTDSGRAEELPPYSRAAATDFHRLPVRGVSGDCGRRRSPPLAKLVMRVSSGFWSGVSRL